jgi:hypothetical protein
LENANANPKPTATSYIVPSWSWASFNTARLLYPPSPRGDELKWQELQEMNVVEAETTLKSPQLVFGKDHSRILGTLPNARRIFSTWGDF